MPNVTYDGQSLFVKGRRAWLVGAGLDYSLLPRSEWGHRLDEVRRSGANTVVTSAPWLRHEARPGRFDFEGQLDLAEFLRLCESRRLWVVLRIGPAIGEPFDGGGLPSWLIESGAQRLREWDERFLERVSSFYRQVLSRATDLQASELRDAGPRGVGPVVAVAIEHRWLCDHETQGQRYLAELVRFARECGVKVPLLTSNQLWQTLESAIDCWEGCDDLLANLRQLRTVQADFPRIALLRDPSLASVWGGGDSRAKALASLPRRVAETLASGAMPLLLDAVGGVHRHRTAGRRLGANGESQASFFAAVEPRGLLLDAHGRPIDGDADLRRLLLFASGFGHLFAEAEPAYQPIAVDPAAGGGGRRHHASTTLSLRGPGGHVAFVFAENPADRAVSLCLDDGRSLPIDLGDAPLGWFVRDIDLRGRGHLDYSNLSPMAMVGRRLLVLFGPAGRPGFLSLDGSHIDLKVPAKGGRPVVVPHREIVAVVLNESQSRAAVIDGDSLLVGCRGIDASGAPIPAAGFAEFLRIALDGSIAREPLPKRRNPRVPAIGAWTSLSEPACLDGTSPRFATLEGPSSLRACGVGSGYGWYRVRFRQPKSAGNGKVQIDLPQAGDRLRIHLDGRLLGVFGEGPGTASLPLSLKLSPGEHTLVVLAEHVGRFADGHGAERRSGLWGPIWETVPLAGVKTAAVEAPHFDPFRLRTFLPGLVQGEAPPERGLEIAFSHRRRTPLLLDLGSWPVPSTLLLEGVPLRRLGGDPSERCTELLRPEALEGGKGGRHRLCIVPDHDHEIDLKAAAKRIKVWECRREIGESGGWGFARRPLVAEVREHTDWQAIPANAARRGGNARGGEAAMPTWFRAGVSIPPQPGTLAIDLASMSRGEAYFDGEPLGTYFSRDGDGKAVGPSLLPVPGELLRPGESQEILLFDEEGASPRQVRLINV